VPRCYLVSTDDGVVVVVSGSNQRQRIFSTV
jgi:hypothetical protein